MESAHGDNDTHAFHSRLFLAMPSCDGPAGQFFADAVSQGGFGMPIHGEDTTQITLEDAVLGGKIILSCNPPMRWESMPHLTVSQSEAGFEKIMQALKLDLFWPVQAGKAQNIEIQVEVLAHD